MELSNSEVSRDRMFCYLWYEKDKPNEAKFGERWVFAGQDPLKEVWRRINNSVGVRKDLVRDGTIQLECIWDVTDYAIKVGRNYIHGKVDDKIRPSIGFRKGTTGEVHELSANEIRIKVNKVLTSVGQPLPVVKLAAWQARSTEDVLYSIAYGNRTILAELCARFGKTIWGGVLVRETNIPLTLIVSYVLTSFASFEKDLSSYDQFKDIVLVDTSDEGYQDIISSALTNKKQVVAFLSMCNGSNRQKKIDFLFARECDRLVLIDEADFGVHKPGQIKPLLKARRLNDVIIPMTGTNADKAASLWPVDHMISTTYPELLMEKRNPLKKYTTTLKNFAIDTHRHGVVVDIEFYQMALGSLLDLLKAVDPEVFNEDGIYLASWSKTAANPIKAKGFWTRMLQSVFLGQHGLDNLNIEYQFEEVADQRVAMMFLPGNTTNDNLSMLEKLAQQALPGYLVLPIYGKEMSNRTAEQEVKETIEKAKKLNQSVLLLSAGMAQRSFSVAEITELYLAYDSGDNGATIQKMSRALTPGLTSKIGRIVSLSFDPNRDDKFDSMLIETAINYKKNRSLTSAKEAMRDVIRTVDIFRCTADGAVKIEADDYLEAAIARKSVSRVVGKVADLTGLTIEELAAIAAGKAEVFRAAKVKAAEKGKTRLTEKKGTRIPNTSAEMASAKLIAQVREVITTVVENLDIIVYGTGTHDLHEAFKIVAADAAMRKAVEEEFGLEFDLIVELFDSGIINQDLVELQVDH